ncbi:MAG: hypothetical protein AMXMBFR64_13600 [Myxococcales bacterium]
MSDRFYVTTPIYYVNDKPHIGHAYCTILADVLARYHRLFGEQTWFLTGVDEHGQKVQEAARKRGMTPQEHCDEMHQHFKHVWPTLHIENDDFIRTTEPRHTAIVQQALQRLFDKGEVYEQVYRGWYSTSVERFWAEEELVNGRCPETGNEVVWIEERNYWFRMGKYRDRLVAHIEANPDFIQPPNRRNEVLGFLQKDLKDLCISRPKERLSWGIELPFDRDFVTYVWFDALLNYCSAIGLYADPDRFQAWWPHVHHLIGKDILTTHCVYWTTMLMALELPLPQRIVATGWWLTDNTKMSKSLGNVVSPLSLKEKYGPEVLRYFLMREMVLGLDANFSEEALVARNNADLANDLGNLLSRATKLLAKEPLDGRVPVPGPVLPEDEETVTLLRGLPEKVRGLVCALKLHAALEEVLQGVRRLNKYVNDAQPFRLVKTDPARAGAVLYNVLEGLRFAATLLWPVMPEKAGHILADIGWAGPPPALTSLTWGELTPGAPVGTTPALFPRYELKVEEAKVTTPEPAPTGKPLIAYADFAKVELRVGEIVAAEAVPKSAKLLKLQVDVGTSVRQIVAGIAQSYAPEQLVGRRAVVLVNLEPRKLFGLQSEGMLLVAEDEAGLSLLTPERPAAPGAEIA